MQFKSKTVIRWSVGVLLLLITVWLAAKWLRSMKPEWEYLSAGKPYSIQTVRDPTGSDEECLRFELREGDAWVNKSGPTFRAEIETRERPPMNSVRWYRFSLFLPPDFPIEDNRLVLAQWHGVDKKELGEPSRIPVLAFRYRNGKLSITMRHSADRIVRDPDAVPSEELFQTSLFPLGKWNVFFVQARWSFTEDGFINIWWNEKRIVSYKGPVGYNDDLAPYFQFGLYRDETDKTYVSYMKRILMGRVQEDVAVKDSQ
jgi:hypothetical protein